MGPDTIFPHSFNYNWSPRYLYNVEKEQTGSFSCIYTLLHQQGKMLKTEWGDKSQQFRHPRSPQIPCSSNVWKLVSVASVCMSTLLENALCVSSAQSMNSDPSQAPAGSVSPTYTGPVLSLQHQSLVVSEAPVTE